MMQAIIPIISKMLQIDAAIPSTHFNCNSQEHPAILKSILMFL